MKHTDTLMQHLFSTQNAHRTKFYSTAQPFILCNLRKSSQYNSIHICLNHLKRTCGNRHSALSTTSARIIGRSRRRCDDNFQRRSYNTIYVNGRNPKYCEWDHLKQISQPKYTWSTLISNSQLQHLNRLI